MFLKMSCVTEVLNKIVSMSFSDAFTTSPNSSLLNEEVLLFLIPCARDVVRI